MVLRWLLACWSKFTNEWGSFRAQDNRTMLALCVFCCQLITKCLDPTLRVICEITFPS